MSNPDRQSKPDIGRSEQGVLNWSFDEIYKVLAVELLGEYGSSLTRLQTDADGNLKVTSTGSGGSSGHALSSYYLVQDTEDSTHEYYGYVKTDGSWVIKRVTLSTNYADFDSGASGYATAWTNRTSGTYADYWSEF